MSERGGADGRPPPRWSFWLLAVARLFGAAAVVALVLGAATVRVIVAGEDEIAASTEALLAGDAREAAVRARRAAGWYAPGAPHVRVAYERLIALAVAAEGLGDYETALVSWRAVRTASIETRWIVAPHDADRRRADEAIARLSALAPRPPGTRAELPQTIERKQLAALARDDAPRTPWVIALVASFVAWAGGAAWVARRGTSATGHLSLRRSLGGMVVAGLGVALWLVALWRA